MWWWWIACQPVSPLLTGTVDPSTRVPTPTGTQPVTPEPLTPSTPPVMPTLPVLGPPLLPERDHESAFGPRESGGDQEFHQGVDWRGTRDEDVMASLPGVVKTVREPSSPSQSRFVIVEHTVPAFDWQGGSFTTLFTSYHHLDSIDVAEDEAVEAGQRLGGMGDSGNADSVHLHYELRLGTHCSLEYQLDNPDSSCVTGFSPHVDPFLALPHPSVPLRVEVLGTSVFVYADRPDAGIRSVITDQGRVDFSAWDAISNTSNDDRDDPDLGWSQLIATNPEGRVLEFVLASVPTNIEVWDASGTLAVPD